jgi:hypothetical protein
VFVKKSPKLLPKPFFVNINTQLYPWNKRIQKIWSPTAFFKNMPKGKQSPNKQKFAQFGHPGYKKRLDSDN